MRILMVVCLAWASVAFGQVVPAAVDGRSAGVDEDSKIAYVLLTVEGKASGPLVKAEDPAPRLTAQCTQDAGGKLRFEVLADFGSATPLAFIAPWRPRPGENFAPPLANVTVTMEFLGYVKEKPVKRQWSYVPELPGELKYNMPAMTSSNMEPIAYYLQYLRALPKLRLTLKDKPVVEFETMKWQERVRAEPLCKASGL